MNTNNQKGFTLIEMLVVVAIVGLLSSVVVVGVGGARQKARDSKRIADLRSIQTWAEANYTTSYPTSAAYDSWSSKPKDPSTGAAYSYCGAGQTYVVKATLEDASNRPAGTGLTSLPSGCSGITCDASANYCIGPSS